jgi:hypothetical protein
LKDAMHVAERGRPTSERTPPAASTFPARRRHLRSRAAATKNKGVRRGEYRQKRFNDRVVPRQPIAASTPALVPIFDVASNAVAFPTRPDQRSA